MLGLLSACTGKLDLKPDSAIILPKTARDLELILDNTEIMNHTPGLAHISADEYFIPSQQLWQSVGSPTARNAHIWAKDIYEGESNVKDWAGQYNTIFYCNNVLDILAHQDITNDAERKRLKGWALFARAYTFYSLLSIFAKPYDAATASADLGIPLKLNANIDEVEPRSSVQQSYDQLIADAKQSIGLLQQDIIKGKPNQPSKVAAYAFLARVFLSMRKYEQAEIYADQSLAIHAKLTDFNTLSKTGNAWTSSSLSEELLYYSGGYPTYSAISIALNLNYGVSMELINLYDKADLRLPIYFQVNKDGNYNIKNINTHSSFPFTGLATDEVLLIKAECLARRGQTEASMDIVNQIGVKRWNPNATTPAKPYPNMTASSPEMALEKVLTERRKALVWRSVRWIDLRRLNLEGRNITPTRKLGDQVYTLPPNSPLYVLPIPDDEIALSGVVQNVR
jgi:tetratricopeptide (TPR) repeat protein